MQHGHRSAGGWGVTRMPRTHFIGVRDRAGTLFCCTCTLPRVCVHVRAGPIMCELRAVDAAGQVHRGRHARHARHARHDGIRRQHQVREEQVQHIHVCMCTRGRGVPVSQSAAAATGTPAALWRDGRCRCCRIELRSARAGALLWPPNKNLSHAWLVSVSPLPPPGPHRPKETRATPPRCSIGPVNTPKQPGAPQGAPRGRPPWSPRESIIVWRVQGRKI